MTDRSDGVQNDLRDLTRILHIIVTVRRSPGEDHMSTDHRADRPRHTAPQGAVLDPLVDIGVRRHTSSSSNSRDRYRRRSTHRSQRSRSYRERSLTPRKSRRGSLA